MIGTALLVLFFVFSMIRTWMYISWMERASGEISAAIRRAKNLAEFSAAEHAIVAFHSRSVWRVYDLTIWNYKAAFGEVVALLRAHEEGQP